jgi:ketosteroid isomerase-like protein
MARDVSPTALELVTNEYRFCQWAKYRGIREAFLSHLSGDAVVFKPRPTNGRAWFLHNSDIPGHLTWQPLYVESSASNDLGYTTGPWVYTSLGDSPSHGHYVTFWKRLPDVGWKAILDVGTTHPPFEAETELSFHHNWYDGHPNRSNRDRRRLMGTHLLDADRSFAEASRRQGPGEAFAAVWSRDVRLYRMGSRPDIGILAAMATVRNKAGVMTLTPTDSVVAAAGDLGFTYGLCRFQAHGHHHEEEGSYLRAWRNDDGCWRIVLDLVVPIPSEETANS